MRIIILYILAINEGTLFHLEALGVIVQGIWFDWRAAAVVNSDGVIIDVDEWSGPYKVNDVMQRLELLKAGAMTTEARSLLIQFPDSILLPSGSSELPEANYPIPDDDAQLIADEAALKLAEDGVALAAGDPDRRLEHLIGAAEELRSAWVTGEGRMVEWVGLFIPQARFESDRSKLATQIISSANIAQLAETLNAELPPVGPEDSEWHSLHSWALYVSNMEKQLNQIENSIRTITRIHLPSLTALLGPLLSARLCVSAHGRMRLARLPAGTIQVLGAEKAFFHHLKTGAPPPKHGHLFMHPWISRSPRWVRGKISRMLASKAAIAARCDAFGGVDWSPEQIQKIEDKVNDIRTRHPKPKQIQR